MKSLKNISSGIATLKRVRPLVSMHTPAAIKIYKGLIEQPFDYILQRYIGWLDPTAK